MNLVFQPWRMFFALRDRRAQKAYLLAVAKQAERSFFDGIASPKSGIHHRHLPNRSSAPGEYPARQSGALRRSIRSRVTEQEATIGTNVYYAKWLRGGSRKMARRKMSDNALREGMQAANRTKAGRFRWVRWAHA